MREDSFWTPPLALLLLDHKHPNYWQPNQTLHKNRLTQNMFFSYKMPFLVDHTRQYAPSSSTFFLFSGALLKRIMTLLLWPSLLYNWMMRDSTGLHHLWKFTNAPAALFSRCEITYLDISLGCPLVHATNVRTIGETGFVLFLFVLFLVHNRYALKMRPDKQCSIFFEWLILSGMHSRIVSKYFIFRWWREHKCQ